MSILIKGMEMPTSCSECPLLEGCSECEGYHNCCMPLGIENGYFDYPLNDLTPIDKRRDDCPLVPVPPHGGLIDADALERVAEDMQKQAEYFDERARQLVCDSGEVSQYSWAVSLRETYRRFVKALDEISTSTIIEAEEGE